MVGGVSGQNMMMGEPQCESWDGLSQVAQLIESGLGNLAAWLDKALV